MERSGPRFERTLLVAGPPNEVLDVVVGVAERRAHRPVFSYTMQTSASTVSLRRDFLPGTMAMFGLLGSMLLVGFWILLVVRNEEMLALTVSPEPASGHTRVSVSALERGIWVSSGQLGGRVNVLSTELEKALKSHWQVQKEGKKGRSR